MHDYHDTLAFLQSPGEMGSKLAAVHEVLLGWGLGVDRIACALYDPGTDLLKTFVHSSGGASPLVRYQARLADVPSLREIVEKQHSRIVDDLTAFDPQASRHTRLLQEEGYRSSFTMPLRDNGELFGFLFLDSRTRANFSHDVMARLTPWCHLIGFMVLQDLKAMHTLLATLRTARDITHARDGETGAHLDRMSRFSRVIAQRVAQDHGLDDETIERIFLFAPMHDVGKIGIPDAVLLKPGGLDEQELGTMRSHAHLGRELIDRMLANYGLAELPQADMLRNIAEFHHESVDGSGYPHGARTDEIPIEARIVSVADVFDALTSRRPYKPAWSNERAVASLQSLAGTKLDAQCVEALVAAMPEIEAIQQQFEERAEN